MASRIVSWGGFIMLWCCSIIYTGALGKLHCQSKPIAALGRRPFPPGSTGAAAPTRGCLHDRISRPFRPVAVDFAGWGLTLSSSGALPGTGLDAAKFWSDFADLLGKFAPENAAPLAKREDLQAQIDAWHEARAGQAHDAAALSARSCARSAIWSTRPRRSRVGTQQRRRRDRDHGRPAAGGACAQRALRAQCRQCALGQPCTTRSTAPTRCDAARAKPGGYDPERGAQVIAYAKAFLDRAVELADRSWSEVTGITIENGRPRFAPGEVTAALEADWHAEGDDPWGGLPQMPASRTALIFRHNGPAHRSRDRLGDHPIGTTTPPASPMSLLEAALTTIIDLEDCVAAVDGEDKVLGLCQLAWPDARRSGGKLRQGRQDAYSRDGGSIANGPRRRELACSTAAA